MFAQDIEFVESDVRLQQRESFVAQTLYIVRRNGLRKPV